MDTIAFVAFFKEIEGLKSTLRWNQTRTGLGESTAAHTWRLTLMTILIAEELNKTLPQPLDVMTSVKIALLHDLPETYLTRDVDPGDIRRGAITAEQKAHQEAKDMRSLLSFLPAHLAEELWTLWQNYETGSTPEGLFVKSLDKLETILQLTDTPDERWEADIAPPEFVGTYGNKNMVKTPYLKPLIHAIKAELEQKFTHLGYTWSPEYLPIAN